MTSKLDIEPGTPTYAALRDRLRAEILSGRLAAGARLTTASLVERFGVSQMPVREALQALEGEGLIEIAPHKGAAVLALDGPRMRNIYDLRGALETLLIRLALPNLSNRVMAEIAALHRHMQDEVGKQDPSNLYALNDRFHKLIYRHAENDEAFDIYDRYARLLGTLRDNFGFSKDRVRDMMVEHEAIIDALRAQDEDRLVQLVADHCQGAKIDLLAQMDRKPPPSTRRDSDERSGDIVLS
jgi:DNA-binding GntR family transcriptional regulator